MFYFLHFISEQMSSSAIRCCGIRTAVAVTAADKDDYDCGSVSNDDI